MAVEKITISSQHRLKCGELIRWAKAVPVTAFEFRDEGGVRIALVERNYYLDQETNKIRFQKYTYDDCSWDRMYSMYVLIDRGIYSYAGVVTLDDRVGGWGKLDKKMKEKATVRRRLGGGTIAQFHKELRWYD